MSDSVDRVFVHALATVRRLPRTGSSRPPPAARLRLYGLYKQSMEGDVSSILPRPAFPPNSPNPNDPTTSSNPTVHRYANRALRTREAQAEIEKWDAWHACAGMTRTEAKRRYITTLIETMKEYASGTSESRELVSELEFVWNQIKSQSGSDESESGESGESPTRKLERSGMKATNVLSPDGDGTTREGNATSPVRSRSRSPLSQSAQQTRSRIIPGVGGGSISDKKQGGSLFSRIQSSVSNLSSAASFRRPGQVTRTKSGLRVLSPMSQHSSDDVVENEEVNPDDDEEEDRGEGKIREPTSPYQTSPSSPVSPQPEDRDLQHRRFPPSSHHNADPSTPSRPSGANNGLGISNNHRNTNHDRPPQTQDPWRTSIETQLKHLTLELTALREQLSSHHLLSRSSFSAPIFPPNSSHLYSSSHHRLPFVRRMIYRLMLYLRFLVLSLIRQLLIQMGILAVVIFIGRVRGDRRVEMWVKGKMKMFWRGWIWRVWVGEGLGGIGVGLGELTGAGGDGL